MAIVTLVIGESGSGKSASLRNIDPKIALLIQPEMKSLPFKSKAWRTTLGKANKEGSLIVTSNYDKAELWAKKGVELGKKIIIIDDANYFMQNESLALSELKGYDKFTSMSKNYLHLFKVMRALPADVRVYVMSHTQTDESGFIKPKTIGKMIDSQVVLEGLFTIVLRAVVKDGEHFFTTKTNGLDCVKTPIGMFSESEIKNDLASVDAEICEYEEI